MKLSDNINNNFQVQREQRKALIVFLDFFLIK